MMIYVHAMYTRTIVTPGTIATEERLKCRRNQQRLNQTLVRSPLQRELVWGNLSQPLHGWCKSLVRNAQTLPAKNPPIKNLLNLKKKQLFHLISCANPQENNHTNNTNNLSLISPVHKKGKKGVQSVLDVVCSLLWTFSQPGHVIAFMIGNPQWQVWLSTQ